MKETVAPAGLVAGTAIGAGTVTTGAVVSVTVTVNEAVAEVPPLSAAVHVTVVVPRGNTEPVGGVQVTRSAAPKPSAAVGGR